MALSLKVLAKPGAPYTGTDQKFFIEHPELAI